ncbi:MAG: flagellar hook-basal body complex protein FliE [Sulfuricella sp.]|jgi:flagellar hook-basal body complex protein FliE|nr:flagellar hook-basal body complex protein FliE [Sulfuricella sp.]
MNIQGIDQLLSQMQATAAAAGGNAQATRNDTDFSSLLKSSIDQVNSAQQESKDLARNFELGKTDASLQEVMISLQKANVSFQAMVQVRNKLVSAYQDVMNMQV